MEDFVFVQCRDSAFFKNTFYRTNFLMKDGRLILYIRGEWVMKSTLVSKDFMLVVIGQIISLFGNAALRFALPLYLLNLTGSSAVYGTVTACAFIPAILLSPIGGIVADRVNKRNIMVLLDFATALLLVLFLGIVDVWNPVVLIALTLMILYGIAGAYQPSVQASIPALVHEDEVMVANAIINTISFFSSLVGPVVGGILYSVYGLKLILWMCMACFVISAIMEVFINIPFERQDSRMGLWKTVREDLLTSFHFIKKDKPIIGKVLVMTCGINLFLASMVMVALPYLITEVLDLGTLPVNSLYGFAEGALAVGGLVGGICAGIFAKKLPVQTAGTMLVCCVCCVFPLSVFLLVCSSGLVNYFVLTGCCFFIMMFSTICTVQMMSFVQKETPSHLVGKVVALIMTLSMCAQPLGMALYGILFEACQGIEFIVCLMAGAISLVIALKTCTIFHRFEEDLGAFIQGEQRENF